MIARTGRLIPVVGWLSVVLMGVLLGAAVPLLAPTLGLPAIPLLVGAVALGLWLMVSGPAGCIGAVAALATLGGQAWTVQVGPVDLQVADAFYAALVLWVIAPRPTDAQRTGALTGAAVGIPTAGILVFICFVGLTIVKVALVDPGHLETSLVSWLRLAQTASLIWLTAASVTTPVDVRRILKIVALAGTAAVIVALAQAIEAGAPSILRDRFGGLLNENSLALVSGLLVLLSFSGRFRQAWPATLALGCIGMVGLILSKSVAATIATALVLGIGHGLRQRRQSEGTDRVVKVILVTGLGLFVAVALIGASRPEVLPTSPRFGSSSATHRAVVAAAGWRIFAGEPVIGVGWQRSSSPAVIGTGEIAAALRDQFPSAKPYFFPDVTPTSVHNAYVQVLAELGLIGFALFTVAMARSALGIRRLIHHMRVDHELASEVRFMALGLLLILIWWNDNPIFGGQVETVLASIFLGMLVSVSRNATGETQGYLSRSAPGRVAA